MTSQTTDMSPMTDQAVSRFISLEVERETYVNAVETSESGLADAVLII